MRLISKFAIVLTFVNGSCRPYVRPATHVVIDCFAQDQAKLETFAAELLPLFEGEQPNWATFQERAVDAGVNIGGCVAATLIQKYLAPAPGNAAPSPENSQAAHEAFEAVRKKFNGAQFKTEHGTL